MVYFVSFVGIWVWFFFIYWVWAAGGFVFEDLLVYVLLWVTCSCIFSRGRFFLLDIFSAVNTGAGATCPSATTAAAANSTNLLRHGLQKLTPMIRQRRGELRKLILLEVNINIMRRNAKVFIGLLLRDLLMLFMLILLLPRFSFADSLYDVDVVNVLLQLQLQFVLRLLHLVCWVFGADSCIWSYQHMLYELHVWVLLVFCCLSVELRHCLWLEQLGAHGYAFWGTLYEFVFVPISYEIVFGNIRLSIIFIFFISRSMQLKFNRL